MKEVLVSSFYALTPLTEGEMEELLATLQQWPAGLPPLKGLILVAPDGLNATIAGSQASVEAVENWLGQRLPLSTIKHSWCLQTPFGRWKVVRRRETITSGPIGQTRSGPARRLNPSEWHQMLTQPGVTVIDVRNDYEVELGRFRGALDPKTRTFTQFADYVRSLALPRDQPVLTYCTGGIRCEKATAFMQDEGFTQVFHLDGGILNYLEQYPHGLFEGECFVFDERVALDQELQPTRRFRRCPTCGQPACSCPS